MHQIKIVVMMTSYFKKMMTKTVNEEDHNANKNGYLDENKNESSDKSNVYDGFNEERMVSKSTVRMKKASSFQ